MNVIVVGTVLWMEGLTGKIEAIVDRFTNLRIFVGKYIQSRDIAGDCRWIFPDVMEENNMIMILHMSVEAEPNIHLK